MIIIYIHGCNCGINATYIRKVKAYVRHNEEEFQLKNSKYDKADLAEHIAYLSTARLHGDNYQPIVVHDGAITPLRLWNL